MKSKLISIKVDPADYARWQAALKSEGRTVADVARAALERTASRIERKAEEAGR